MMSEQILDNCHSSCVSEVWEGPEVYEPDGLLFFLSNAYMVVALFDRVP